MKKSILSIALLVACMGITNAATDVNVDAGLIQQNQASVATTSEALYTGTATVSKMNGVSMSGSYDAEFYYDTETDEIYGEFSVGSVHDIELSGTLSGGATGTVSILGVGLDFTATFSNVTVSGNTLIFTCSAILNSSGLESIFTFSGTK
jgi:hypothetical protein